MKKFRITVAAKSYSIEIGDLRGSPMTVVVDGEAFSVDVQPLEDAGLPTAEPEHPVPPDLTAAEEVGPSRVTAPMPGKILDVAVLDGDRVQRGQVLCTLEAMKMKSPIRAPRAGTVGRVQVQQGQTVEHGDLLFVVD